MAQLCLCKDEMDELGVSFLLITSSWAGYTERFKQEVRGAFSVLINRERDVYRTYGLESSFLRSWGPKYL